MILPTVFLALHSDNKSNFHRRTVFHLIYYQSLQHHVSYTGYLLLPSIVYCLVSYGLGNLFAYIQNIHSTFSLYIAASLYTNDSVIL